MNKENRPFNFVQMNHLSAERIRKELEGTSEEERLAYWREASERQSKIHEEAIPRD